MLQQHISLQRVASGSSPRRRVGCTFCVAAVGCLCLQSGCNQSDKPLTIDPAGELAASQQEVLSHGTAIHVPEGWSGLRVLRDDSGRAVHVACDRYRGERVADMLFVSSAERPSWTREQGCLEGSTRRHQRVFYQTEVRQARQKPSGETPVYELTAAVQIGDGWWTMVAGFRRPVRPEFLTALGYIDAIEP
jgi:hypothetical protein